ncbi:hypothetical protein DFP72DRAFT_839580 [Ephemerocybe angulata]|uniref:Uncharacterized protein n=1 Tax=Ephemerocybe angulata TaxID=980116 RepID=A0A8H6IHR8_9AGAR|nr:hypothetical protein DFP72DRAFT_839580 [Tulosesus angulatus]
MLWIDGITKDEALKMVRNANIDDLQHWAVALPPEMVPKFHDEIGENYAGEPFCLRLCLLVWIASNFTQVPKALQLKAALAFLEKKNSLLYAGTGFGKTMMVVHDCAPRRSRERLDRNHHLSSQAATGFAGRDLLEQVRHPYALYQRRYDDNTSPPIRPGSSEWRASSRGARFWLLSLTQSLSTRNSYMMQKIVCPKRM